MLWEYFLWNYEVLPPSHNIKCYYNEYTPNIGMFYRWIERVYFIDRFSANRKKREFWFLLLLLKLILNLMGNYKVDKLTLFMAVVQSVIYRTNTET
jgi:hypothetical protein